MAVDMFLKLTDIEGEAQDDSHGKETDVLAWSWGLSQSGTFHVGGGGGSGKANFQDISVTKYVDKSSMTLMGKIASGEHIDEATLIVRKAGGKNPLEYIKIVMKKVRIATTINLSLVTLSDLIQVYVKKRTTRINKENKRNDISPDSNGESGNTM